MKEYILEINDIMRNLFAAIKKIVTQINHVNFYNQDKNSLVLKIIKKLSENIRNILITLKKINLI